MKHIDTTQLTTVHLDLDWFELIWIGSLELGNNKENLKEITVIESEKLNQNIRKTLTILRNESSILSY